MTTPGLRCPAHRCATRRECGLGLCDVELLHPRPAIGGTQMSSTRRRVLEREQHRVIARLLGVGLDLVAVVGQAFEHASDAGAADPRLARHRHVDAVSDQFFCDALARLDLERDVAASGHHRQRRTVGIDLRADALQVHGAAPRRGADGLPGALWGARRPGQVQDRRSATARESARRLACRHAAERAGQRAARCTRAGGKGTASLPGGDPAVGPATTDMAPGNRAAKDS